MERVAANGTELVGAEGDAKRILEGLGLVPQKVPTTSERTADFEVKGDEPPYLVEVKSRLLDKRLVNPAQPHGEPVTKSMRHDAKVGEWLADSKQQFRTLDPQHDRLWFLWCSMEGWLSGGNQAERTISVLYGVREARDVQPPHRNLVVFYAMPAAFDRFPDVDGAVVIWPEGHGITFCPNEASPRLEITMRSKLVRSLRAAGMGPILPSERATAMKGYVVPPNVRSAGHGAVLKHVQHATGLPYINFLAREVEFMQTGKIVFPGG